MSQIQVGMLCTIPAPRVQAINIFFNAIDKRDILPTNIKILPIFSKTVDLNIFHYIFYKD